MKRNIVTVITILVIQAWSFAALTLYTPNGNIVIGSEYAEFTDAEITQLNNDFRQDFPLAQIVAPASYTYNCHGYAWYMVEMQKKGKDVIPCWIHNPFPFWEDGSYVKTDESSADKIIYGDGDHIAIPHPPGKYISKFGMYPLAIHDPLDTPYPTPLTYYKKNPTRTINNKNFAFEEDILFDGDTVNVINVEFDKVGTSKRTVSLGGENADFDCKEVKLEGVTIKSGVRVETTTSTAIIKGPFKVEKGAYFDVWH